MDLHCGLSLRGNEINALPILEPEHETQVPVRVDYQVPGTQVLAGNGSVQVSVFSSKMFYKIWWWPGGTINFWGRGSNCVTFYIT